MTAATHEEIYRRSTATPTGGLLLGGAVLALAGIGLFAMLAMGDDPARAWRIFLVDFVFFTGLAQGAVVFSAVQVVVKGRWAGSIVRFGEAAAGFLPISFICFIVLFLGRFHLFPWIENPTPARGPWLTTQWVFWRDLVSLVLVFGVSFAYVRNTLKPDLLRLRDHVSGWRQSLYSSIIGTYDGSEEQEAALNTKLSRLAPLLIMLYAYLFSLLAFDLIMSLSPWWISNLFGAYYFMGSFLTGLAMMGLMMVYWRGKLGMKELAGKKVFHDLGKLIFGFTVFWAYLTYSQFLVIWYGNLPEETSFIFFRLWGEWRPIGILVGLMVFLIPFWGLIWVKAKINPFTFSLFLTVSLSGMWLERYLMIQPSLAEHGPAFGLPEFGVTAGFLGLFLLGYGLFATAFPMVSPRAAEKAMVGHH